ncbi:MAG: hypothetical protein PW843_08850 [Azospirillaceae bacterium]|nr:hypothetical protein [Azospirillaceae bacterium]
MTHTVIPTTLLISAPDADHVSLMVADLTNLYGTRVRVADRFIESSASGTGDTHCASVEIIGRDPWLRPAAGAAA